MIAIRQKLTKILLGTSIFLSHFATGPLCHGEVPSMISYQGRLTEENGQPLVGDHALTFRLYDAETGGAKLWEEGHRLVLGASSPLSRVGFNQPLWLSLEVDKDGEMAPRLRLTAAGYAMNAQTLDGLASKQLVRADVDTELKGRVKLTGSGSALVIQPALPSPPGASLLEVRSTAGQPQFRVDADGNVVVHGNLAVRGTISGALTGNTSGSAAGDAVRSLGLDGQPPLAGPVTLTAGPGIALDQAGQAIRIAATGSGSGPSAHASASASDTVTIGTDETELLSVSLTKTQANSALFVLASVQLAHSANPASKTVEMRLYRDGSLIDGGYQARLGSGAGAVSQLPVSIQAWDASGAGAHTISFRARSSDKGAQATARRLTVVELF